MGGGPPGGMGAFLRRQLLVAAAALHAHRAPAAVHIADFATVAHDAAVGWAPLPGCANRYAVAMLVREQLPNPFSLLAHSWG